jgi:ABC-type transport system involved in multi-copper enzyme maturation permease subunit
VREPLKRFAHLREEKTPFIMSDRLEQLLLACPVLCLIQALAALPWLSVLDPDQAKAKLRRPGTWGALLLGTAAVGVVFAFLLVQESDAGLIRWGRGYASLLHVQLAADFFVVVFALLLWLWPKGGAVALASFREGVRQPMFWLLTLFGLGLMVVTTGLPFWTFGEDYKMMKELGFSQMMLFAAAFGIIAASSSISEEIEGRTAVTLMSKPVSRRHFLLGKFAGILLAALVMALIMGWTLAWLNLYKEADEFILRVNPPPPPAWVLQTVHDYLPQGEIAALGRGILLWVNDAGSLLPGLVISFGHVMILLAVAVALATRVPMLVTVPVCLAVYFLGHLTPILKAVAEQQLQQQSGGLQQTGYQLISFLANVFDVLLPGLDLFDVSSIFIRDTPLPLAPFSLYTLNVAVYAVVYTTIALLFGLILFEDRDLA